MMNKNEVQRMIREAIVEANLVAEYKRNLSARLGRAEAKIHRLTARVGMLEAELAEKKGTVKGYYQGENGKVIICEKEEGEK